MRNELNLQDRMLGALRQQGQPVTVFLTNGFRCAAWCAALTALF